MLCWYVSAGVSDFGGSFVIPVTLRLSSGISERAWRVICTSVFVSFCLLISPWRKVAAPVGEISVWLGAWPREPRVIKKRNESAKALQSRVAFRASNKLTSFHLCPSYELPKGTKQRNS